MKIIAKYNVQLCGRIYTKGQAAEWNGPVDGRIAANFTAADGSPLEAVAQQDARMPQENASADAHDIIERTVNAVGRNGIRRQLDDMGVTYAASSNTKYLAKLLLTVKGEIKED